MSAPPLVLIFGLPLGVLIHLWVGCLSFAPYFKILNNLKRKFSLVLLRLILKNVFAELRKQGPGYDDVCL